MKKMELCRFILIIITLFFIITSSILISYNVMNLKLYSNLLEILGLIFLILYIIDKIKKFHFNKFEIFILILMLLTCLSLFTSININIALFGRVNRYEGLFVILTYYIIMLNGMMISNKKYLKIILFIILTFYFINVIYGLFQVKLISKPSFLKVVSSWKYARGFFGNSMYYGAFSTICYPIILTIFMNSKNIKNKILMGITLIITSIGVSISGSMSTYLACIFIFIFLFIRWIYYLIKKKEKSYKKFSFGFIAFVIFVGSLLFFSYENKYIRKDFKEISGESKEIINGNIKSNFGTGRIYIWENTINKIIENKGLGVGVDNYLNAFKGKLIDVKSGLKVDKAHNDYLQKMLCEGVVSGICYIGFLLFVFLEGLRLRLSDIYYGLFLSFTAYSVQIFFNISVTRVAPFYFLIIGLLLYKLEEMDNI